MTRTLAIAVISLLLSVSAATAQQTPFYDINTIEQFEINFTQSNWRSILASNWRAKIYIKAEVIINGVRFPDAGVRYRGNSTYFALPTGKEDKRPFKIALDEFVDQNYQGYETINLNNNLYDPTCVREVMGYEFMRKFVPAPKCNYAKLKINGQDFGIFINTQQINKELLEQWWEDEDGNRYRGEPTSFFNANNTALTWLGTSTSPYMSAYQLKTENTPTPWSDLINVCNVLNNTPANQRKQVLPGVIDIDNALRFLAVGNVALWLDSYLGRYVHNFYLYFDPTHTRLNFLPWDLNSCFGGYQDTLTLTQMTQLGPFWRENESSRPRPLFKNLVADPRWRARYLAHYRSMVQEYSWAKLGARINDLQNFIGTEIQNDPKRIYSFAWFSQCVTQDINVTRTRQLRSLMAAIAQREQYLATHPDVVKVGPTLTGVAHAPTQVTPNDRVWVTVTVSGPTPTDVTLYHRHRGPFIETKMFDDGQHQDGAANDGVYGGDIPPSAPLATIEYFVSANTDLSQGGAMTLSPTTGSFQPYEYRVAVAPPTHRVLISEFLAKNDTGIRDEQNEREDWIEVMNPGTQPLDVSGMYLTDSPSNPTKWQFPANTTIPAGQTILVWADDEPTDGPLHATFKLSASGEDVAIFDRDGLTPLDGRSFGPQTADVSTGQQHGFPGQWVTFAAPTPGTPNVITPCGHLAYGATGALGDPIELSATGSPTTGRIVTYVVDGAPASTAGYLAIATAPFEAPIPPLGSLLINPGAAFLLPIGTDATGRGASPIPIPNVGVLRGQSFYVQAFVMNGTTGGFSNAILTRICP